jgi:uncharacterized protein YjiS (DUF1127 family)
MNTTNYDQQYPARYTYQVSTTPLRLSDLTKLVSIWRQRTRDRQALQSMEHHMLKDIGMTLVDVHYEVNKPFWRA